jgi:hypothetical protein
MSRSPNLQDDLLLALESAREFIGAGVPSPNCSCHISPPCSDCVDFSGHREQMARIDAALAAAQGEQPEKLVFQLAKPDESSKALKVLRDICKLMETIGSGWKQLDFAADVMLLIDDVRAAIAELERSTPDESEAIKLLGWCIAQFDGTSGAGLNHWIQSPEYRRACELIGQELPPFDEGDEEADEQPVSDPNKLPELPNGELKCTCGGSHFKYVEDICNWRLVKSFGLGILVINSHYDTGEGYDDGHNPRLECTNCLVEYAIPEDVETEFE